MLPKVLPLMGVEDYRPPFIKEAVIETTPIPVVTHSPMELFDPETSQQELVFADSGSYSWFGDPYFYNGIMLFSAGKVVDQQAVLLDLYTFDPVARTAEKLPYTPKNTHFMYARFNDDWLVYLDAKLEGGGCIMAVDRNTAGAEPVLVKDVYSGQPEITLWEHYIVFTDRTGTNMDKLFVCDLDTMETVTLAMFQKSAYGQSVADIENGIITWADSDVGGLDVSAICTIELGSTTINTYSPGTYVHDVENDGKHMAWLTAHHSPTTELYCRTGTGEPVLVASGVVDFGLDDEFVAYVVDETLYAYMFDYGRSFRISPEQQKVQFLGVSDGMMIWQDVTSQDVSRDIVMYTEIP